MVTGMDTLTTHAVDKGKLEKEAFSLLINTYVDLSRLKDLPPNIDVLYNDFKEKWTTEMHEFVVENAEAWEFDINEFTETNVPEKLQELGFVIPSHNMIHNTLNRHRIAYINKKGEMVNGAVVEVW